MFGKTMSLLAFLIVFCLGSVVVTETTVNAKDEERYVGNIIDYKFGMIQLEHNDPTIQKKILYLIVDSKTVVLSGKKPVNLSEVWQKTKKVRVNVSKGKVQQIDILEWK
jgi:hypothetical protein